MPTTTHACATRTREDFWQASRAVCIIAVIWIHSRTGESYAGTPASWNYDYSIVVRQFLNFPVAVFIFMAGYFVNPARISPLRPWLKGRAARLLIPYAAWSLIFSVALGARTPSSIPLDFATGLLTGQAAAHLYFVLVLAQLTGLTPLLVKALEKRWAPVLFAITPAYLVWIYIHTLSTGDLPSGYASWAPAWLAFYFAGLWARLRPRTHSRRPTLVWLRVLALLLTLLLSLVEAYLLLDVGAPYGLAISQLKLSSIAYAFAVIGAATACKPMLDERIPTRLRRIGDESYGIYYVHLFWISAIGALIGRFDELASFAVLPLLQTIEVTLTLLLSIFAIALTRRLIGSEIAGRILGF